MSKKDDDIKPLPENESTRGIADIVLNLFYEKKYIDRNVWYESIRHLPYYDEVMRFLVAEGFLEETPRSFKITYKGRFKVDDGGFVGAYRRERFALRLSCLAVVVSIVAATASIAALVVTIAE